ncbi:DUF5131 family protein [Nocardia niigatensis]
MGVITSIGWTFSDDGNPGATWNIGSGCTRIGNGCLNCYIERQAPLRTTHRRFDGDQIGADAPIMLHPKQMDLPLRLPEPTRIFFNSLTDTFHDHYEPRYIARAWAVMATTRWHTFQVPTKRPARMRSLLSSTEFVALVDAEWEALPQTLRRRGLKQDPADRPSTRWPLDNVWMGVSVEDQDAADRRVPLLRRTPAALRFVSAEPLLEMVDLRRHLDDRDPLMGPPLDWVIVGGESGPRDRIRRMAAEWAWDLHAQCAAAGTAYFFKQTGAVLAREWGIPAPGDDPAAWLERFPQQFPRTRTAAASALSARI